MVLGTATDKVHSVHRKSDHHPDHLRDFLGNCDLPHPAGARSAHPPGRAAKDFRRESVLKQLRIGELLTSKNIVRSSGLNSRILLQPGEFFAGQDLYDPEQNKNQDNN
jgi:hypothetical protein